MTLDYYGVEPVHCHMHVWKTRVHNKQLEWVFYCLPEAWLQERSIKLPLLLCEKSKPALGRFFSFMELWTGYFGSNFMFF